MTTTEDTFVSTKFRVYSKKGRALLEPVRLCFTKGRIEFLTSPFSLKDEIKSMGGSKWHGFDDEPRKIWSVADSFRNRFQLAFLERGDEVYSWFDQEDKKHEYTRPLTDYQKEDVDHWLTTHFGIEAAGMGLGKTLISIEVIERSGHNDWWYVAPKKVCAAITREFKKWKLDPSIAVDVMTYEALTRKMNEWTKDTPIPHGVIFDESSWLKTADAKRSRAAQFLADHIRAKYGYEGFVLLMSGTPSPKTPVDWWSQCEIAFPGFLKEGSEKAFKARLAFLARREFVTGGIHNELIGWKDDENKCATCGEYQDDGPHNRNDTEYHTFAQSVNEVADLYDRLKGLVSVRSKSILNLPEKTYRKVYCKPSPATLRVAQALVHSSVNAVTAMTLLRELSDGFQYREKSNGTITCPTCDGTGEVKEWFDPSDAERVFRAIDMLDPEIVANLKEQLVTCHRCDGAQIVDKTKREAREVPCPKEPALIAELQNMEKRGRIVIAAGFTGSVDRCVRICLEQDWTVVRCDGRGFHVFYRDGEETKTLRGVDALDYWANLDENRKVSFVCHPESGGMGLTLIEACRIVIWSNSYKPQYRIQLEDRIHRLGMDEDAGAEIVDLLHMPTDEKALLTIRENRRLELLTMGEIAKAFEAVTA